jgi:VanZ family protein
MMAALARRPWVLLAVLLAYLGAVVALSHLSGATMRWIGLDIWDKAAHFTEYVPIGLLTAAYLVLRRGRPRGRVGVLALTASLALAFGVLDELHQHFVPGRMCSATDLIADTLGASLGGALGLLFFSRRAASSSPS